MYFNNQRLVLTKFGFPCSHSRIPRAPPKKGVSSWRKFVCLKLPQIKKSKKLLLLLWLNTGNHPRTSQNLNQTAMCRKTSNSKNKFKFKQNICERELLQKNSINKKNIYFDCSNAIIPHIHRFKFSLDSWSCIYNIYIL